MQALPSIKLPFAEGREGFGAGQEGNWRKAQKSPGRERGKESKRKRRENLGVSFDPGVKRKSEMVSEKGKNAGEIREDFCACAGDIDNWRRKLEMVA